MVDQYTVTTDRHLDATATEKATALIDTIIHTEYTTHVIDVTVIHATIIKADTDQIDITIIDLDSVYPTGDRQ